MWGTRREGLVAMLLSNMANLECVAKWYCMVYILRAASIAATSMRNDTGPASDRAQTQLFMSNSRSKTRQASGQGLNEPQC